MMMGSKNHLSVIFLIKSIMTIFMVQNGLQRERER
jgi:hypothetical protein